jgi:hypothetical protein
LVAGSIPVGVLRFGFFRWLRLRRLRKIRLNNALVRDTWKKLCALRDHMADRASCHSDGRVSARCRAALGL